MTPEIQIAFFRTQLADQREKLVDMLISLGGEGLLREGALEIACL